MESITRGLFVILMIFVLSSCQKEIEADKGPITVYFDEIQTDRAFSKLDNQAKWLYLNKLLDTSFINQDALKSWITPALSNLCDTKDFYDHQVLTPVSKKIHKLDFREASYVIGQYILNAPESLDLKEAEGIAGVILSSYYSFNNNKDSLAKYFNVIENAIKTDTSKWLKISYFSNKALLAELRGEFFEATVNYHNAISNIPSDDFKNLTTLYLNLAGMYINLDYIEKAEFYAQKVLEYSNIDDLTIQNIGTLALIQSKVKDFKNSENSFTKIIEYAKANDKPMLLAQTYANFGNLKRKQNLYQEGLAYMDLSDSICRVFQVDFGVLVNGINRAELFYDQKNFQKADQILKTNESLMNSYDIPKLRMEYYKLFYKVQDSLNNQTLANKYYRLYKDSHELYFGDITRSIIVEWELASEREMNTQEMSALALNVEKQKKDKYLISFVLTLGIFILGLFYFFAHRRNILEKEKAIREKLSLSYALELKSKELLSESLNALNIQNTKQWIQEELQTLISQLPSQHQPPFNELKRKLRVVKQNNFLEEFEVRFNGVYEDFYQKIVLLAPDLTPKELRLCALMRLNISTKEIALLTNRSLGTIENARISIRKKLNIDSQVNLQQFLISI